MRCKRCGSRVQHGDIEIREGGSYARLFHTACGQRMIKRLPPRCDVTQVGPKIIIITEAGVQYTLPDDLACLPR